MTEQDKYPRVTKAQLEIWLDNPVTQNYLKCLDFEVDKLSDAISSGALFDSSDNNLSMNKVHSVMGSRSAMTSAQDFPGLLTSYGMVEE